ncbi:hypothetical protein So717_27940 [Roseobacter cerasinus]|uniref:Uncharacterized protein n=1 Tax=Roseobacter cerasinus TaxID=2602289 RepID=A0A640VVC7_9RHOB|nr:hypothetical protein So717_27940 [Roseobacter cerasinus]
MTPKQSTPDVTVCHRTQDASICVNDEADLCADAFKRRKNPAQVRGRWQYMMIDLGHL